MIIQVKLFAVAKQIVGSDTYSIESDQPISIAKVREELLSVFPQLEDVMPHTRFAVNAAYASDETVIQDGDEVAIIPPVSGG